MRTLPEPFATWFASRGWKPRPHQMQMLAAAEAGESALLIAPTGGGKTLAGFLPSLIQLHRAPQPGLHTLYISPLKALAVDIARNLTEPAAEMALDIRIETRTGDTPANRRARQRTDPPQILLTTPESLTLLLSLSDAHEMFGSLKCVVLDEIHALAGTKRGDQLALCLSRLSALAPDMRRVGLSATVAHPRALAAWCAADADPDKVRTVRAAGGVKPKLETLLPSGRLPWGGHMGLTTMPEVYGRLRDAAVTIVFTNTRAQSELCFQALWRLNDDNLPIALHHGSLTVEQRRKVEAAMAAGKLRAVVATASLDLGIDWGAVDQVIQVGAPKGVARLLQRVGRANHRMDEPSRAALVPANRFEVIECRAAIESVAAGEMDGEPPRPGGLDVLAQHILAMACHAPFLPDELYAEIRGAAPYAGLTRQDFEDTLRFVEDGGYALSGYDRFRRLFRDFEGRVHVRGPQVQRQLRMNLGTIVETPAIKVRMRGGPVLGEVEEWFVSTLEPGDNFIFAGQVLRFEAMDANAVIVSRGGGDEPRVPAYAGSKLPLSTHLARRVRGIISDKAQWKSLPKAVREWLGMQELRSELPPLEGLLVEVFQRGNRWFTVAYCFEGRLAHQTLGMLVTKRMERLGWGPLGFLGTDYVMAVWSAFEPGEIEQLFEEDLLGEELEEWIAESSMLRRTFRNIATIAGLLEKNHPGQEKSGRQMTMSADLIYDVLRKHEPDHILLRATRAEAAFGLTDVRRIATLLERARDDIRVRRLDRVSPLAVPALIEEGREWVSGTAEDALLAEATALVSEATWGEDSFTGEISDGAPEPPPPPPRAPRKSRSMQFAARRPRRPKR
ncbi:ligase-associated DNA damage response DEXH box helicase [Roseomonas haemaphysalidis]|uniref:Ligase-associated DNA damage response DEXH box helicase n=1 Tax=Roseomonas haemaphysalidis TaxID=2768162 RepID=A0ABS3KRY4_9PROT|nr:ligase-associated DNA damage response DEXH box helicase [Roseomonas haemaphysalidis]MBO1080233.1 ligase-associated DNA damage response DEXH box helicase [Roseomonas haemaphysalidis]